LYLAAVDKRNPNLAKSLCQNVAMTSSTNLLLCFYESARKTFTMEERQRKAVKRIGWDDVLRVSVVDYCHPEHCKSTPKTRVGIAVVSSQEGVFINLPETIP
jgi:hypothetical protein